MALPGISNANEFYSAHYLESVLAGDISMAQPARGCPKPTFRHLSSLMPSCCQCCAAWCWLIACPSSTP